MNCPRQTNEIYGIVIMEANVADDSPEQRPSRKSAAGPQDPSGSSYGDADHVLRLRTARGALFPSPETKNPLRLMRMALGSRQWFPEVFRVPQNIFTMSSIFAISPRSQAQKYDTPNSQSPNKSSIQNFTLPTVHHINTSKVVSKSTHRKA